MHGRETEPGADLAGFGAAQVEQRTPQPAPLPCHTRQPARPAPTQQIQQDRLGLVVARVPDRDDCRAGLVARLHQRGVAGFARSCFEIAAGVDVDRRAIRLGTEAVSGRGDDLDVVRARVAEAMVDVHGDCVVAGRPHEREERERIGAAGTSDQYRTIDIVECGEPRNECRERFAERNHASRSSPSTNRRSVGRVAQLDEHRRPISRRHAEV